MQHRIVTRVSWTLSAVFVLAALSFGWRVSTGPTIIGQAPQVDPIGTRPPTRVDATAREPAAASAAFVTRCARCHMLQELRHDVASTSDDPNARAALVAFLRRHHAAAGVDDADAMLALLLAPQPAKPARR